MSWSFCSKGGGVFLWQGVLVFFINGSGFFFAGVLVFFINGRGFFLQGYWIFFQWQWIFGVRVYVFFESIGEFYRIRV